MAVNKIIIKVDGTQTDAIDFNSAISGLSAGSHSITVEAYNGAALVHTQTRNVTVADETPPTGDYDPDFQEVLDTATTLGVPHPDAAEISRRNQLIIDYKTTGAFAKDDAVFDFSGSADPAFKLICIKRRIQAVAYGSLTWSSDGVKGNGSNAYIDPLYNPSTLGGNWSTNNASVGFRTFDTGSSGTKALVGHYSGSNNNYVLIVPNSGSDSYHNIHRQAVTRDSFASTNYTQIDRPNQYNESVNGTSISSGTGGGTAGDIYILAAFSSGDTTFFSDAGISFIRFGGDTSAEYSEVKSVIDTI